MAGKTYIYLEETLSRPMLTWKDPPDELDKERGEGERTDRGELRQDKQTAYLTLSHVRASRYWTECRSICVLIFFYNTLILCQREVQDWNSFADSQTETSEISAGSQNCMQGPCTT